MAKLFTYIDWTLRIIVAVILGQTLFFKFSGAPESVEIFTKLGIEPYGRIGIGIAELIAVILILIPRTVTLGALLSGGLMAGALMSHITKLGFAGEMASLATLAVVAGLVSAGVLWIHRRKIPVIGKKFT
ncbi:MAG: DoxX family protein [Verrucomicrobiales bacterium]|nr:DoxX family protein [Verrucomicrobiales bacterium]